jgi:protein associated with RNAse G/E
MTRPTVAAGYDSAGGARHCLTAGIVRYGRVVAGRDVQVAFTKYDGTPHWRRTGRYLGEDEHGIWIGCGARTVIQRGDEQPHEIGVRHVMLIPPSAWWVGTFYDATRECELYCDIATPAQWPHPGEVTMVDLDLDVCRLRTGQQVQLLDEDEFAEHQVRYRYPAEVIAAATASADWLRAAISERAAPFGGEHHTWLAQVE